MMNNLIQLLILIIMTGCGFSSGLYQDILKGQDLISNQKYKESVEVYESILKRKPSRTIEIKISFQLGDIYSIYLGNYEKSLYYFNKIINESNEPLWQVKALEKIGNIYFENLKDYKKSKTSYERLINFVPKLENVNFYKYRYAISFFHQKKYKQSIKLLNKIIEEEGNKYSQESIYYLGLSHFYIQEWDQAIKEFKKFLESETQKNKIIETKFMIANAYESSEKLKEAYNIYYSILGEYPNPEVIKNRLNSLYERRVSRKR